ncbi:MAG TPA: hypothetical protein VMB34_08765 [Acetobacteraceae bacterium]|nr:hypothetical protein [Acetobacteraceae bacterium]
MLRQHVQAAGTRRTGVEFARPRWFEHGGRVRGPVPLREPGGEAFRQCSWQVGVATRLA